MPGDARAQLAICARSEQALPTAHRLAELLQLPQVPPGTLPSDCKSAQALLLVDTQTLALQLCGRKMPGAVAVDFGAADMRYRRGAGHNELLGKAVGIGKKRELAVLDATAGLGRDGFVLADLGARVRMYERHPVVAAMLEAGIRAAQTSSDAWLAGVVSRMSLCSQDARQTDPSQLCQADVIYLDPMFERRDKSAAVKKEMALFQFLLQDEPEDEADLLRWALQRPVARVVVKRPARAAPLAGMTPSHSIRSKAVRYDVHVLAGLC